jgi:hypothetical protein
MSTRIGLIAASLLAVTVVSLAGASDRPRLTSVMGTAWKADNTPIKDANVRLRNVVTGKIEGVARANDAGKFTFENIEGGTYVVELLTETGKVRTIGQVFTVAPGETVATFVRVGTKVPWLSAFFNNTAASVASTAATQGITAMAATTPCTSPACH